MATLASQLTVAVALAFVLQACRAQTEGVCYTTVSTSQSIVGYHSQSYSHGTWCGIRRCRRTRYRAVSTTRYRIVYTSQFGCCNGYQRIGSSCSRQPPLDPPTHVIVTNTNAYSLFIEWAPPNTPNGIIMNYTIYLNYNNGTTDVRITDFNTREYLLEGLSPHQLVGIEITASTSAGEGPSSPIEEIRTHQAVPTAVTALVARRISNTSLELTWGPPDVLNGILVYYVVNMSNTSIGFHKTWTIRHDLPSQLTISDLEPYVPYTINISAATHAGEGDVKTIVQFTKEGVPHVPEIVDISRVIPDSIQVIWNQLTLEKSRGFPLSYTVAYSGTERATCPQVDPETDTMIVINSSSGNSQMVIKNLDPRLEYCVAIAASTVAGTSDFSDPKKVPLYSNSLFQLHFSGIGDCIDWVHQTTQVKVMDVIKGLVLQLIDMCNCDFSMEYVADPSLKCETRVDYVIFQARIISTAENMSTDFLHLLQAWASDEPSVTVNLVKIRLVMACSVHLNDIGETECIPSNTTALTMAQQPSLLYLLSIIPAVFMLVVVPIIVIAVIHRCYKKRQIYENDEPHYDEAGAVIENVHFRE